MGAQHTGNAHPPPAWSDVRAEIARVLDRVPALLAAVPDPQAPALGVWTVAETAVHLSQVCAAVPPLARGDLGGVLRAVPATGGLGVASGSVFAGPAALSAWTPRAVEAEPERDPARLGELVVRHTSAFLADDHDDEPRPWLLDGVRGSAAFFGCHLLGELLVHGDDIARAAGGLPWPIEPRAAALVLRGFLFDVFCQGVGADHAHLPSFRVDVRLAGCDRFLLVKDAGGMRLEQPGGGVDVHLRADPAGLLLQIWKRRTTASLVRRGRLLTWGRRPWRIRQLLALAPQV